MTNEDQPQIRRIVADAREEFAISAYQLETMGQPDQSSQSIIDALDRNAASPGPEKLP